MHNDNWSKGHNMGDNETNIALLKQRVDEHEEKLDKFEKAIDDIQELKTNVAILVNKFSSFTPNCPVHQLKMDGFEKRLEKVETITDGLTKKIVTWTAIASVILFLLSQLLIPYILSNYKVESAHARGSTNVVEVVK